MIYNVRVARLELRLRLKLKTIQILFWCRMGDYGESTQIWVYGASSICQFQMDEWQKEMSRNKILSFCP
jgi:hypothetical protein